MSQYLVPSIHLAYVLRQGMPLTEVIARDLAKADRISKGLGPNINTNLVIAHPAHPAGVEAAVRCARQWLQHWKQTRCPVSIDIETSSLRFMSTYLYSIALSGADGRDTAVAFTLHDLITLPYEAERVLRADMKDVLEDALIPKIYQNSPFDRAVLSAKGYRCEGRTTDTLGLHHLVQSEIPHRLGFIGQTYLDTDAWKYDDEGDPMVTTQNIWKLLVYNALDALRTMQLVSPLMADVIDHGNAHMIWLQMAAADLATDLELVGLPINKEKRRQMGTKLLEEIRTKTLWLKEALQWPEFNPMAQNHRAEVYYGKRFLNLNPSAWTPTGGPSTSYKNTTIIDNLENPVVRAIVDIQESTARFSTLYAEMGFYGKNVKDGAFSRAIEPDGRLHCKWNPYGTTGSRFSSSPNAQNLRINDRDFIEAGPGRVLVGSDKNQLELRIAACLAGVQELLTEMAKPNGDPHRLAALAIWADRFTSKLPDEQKLLRDAIKNVVYAALYMAGVKTVYHTVREKKHIKPELRAALDMKTVNFICKSYFGKFHEFKQYHDAKYAKVQRDGFIVIPPFNRIAWFPVQPAPYNEIANRDIQCCGSDIVLYQMLRIQEQLKRCFKDAWIIQHGHDSVVVECWENDALTIQALIDREFGHYILEGPRGSVDLTASASIGKNMHEVK